MWVIKKGSLYLKAGSGHKTPWTNKIEYAAVFRTIEAAKANACGNETVVKLEEHYG